MDKNYYREYYELERKHWWFLARAEILKDQVSGELSGLDHPLILNVGVATGSSSEMLAQFGKVTSVEYEQDCIDFVKDKVNFPIEQGSILELRFADNSYDLVCAFDVIEHVEDHQLAVKEMLRVCKPGGSVILTVPAFMSLWSKHDEVNHHFRRYTKEELLSLFGKNSEMKFISYFNFWLFMPVYALRLFSRLMPKAVKREGSGSDFGLLKSDWINTLFFKLFASENLFLKRKIKFPFGVSVMGVWKKLS